MYALLDPYALLGVAYDASDEEIKEAFHAQMQKTDGSADIVNAYNVIRTEQARLQDRWSNICSFFCPPVIQTQTVDKEALIRELAFQSEWELGDDAWLTKE